MLDMIELGMVGFRGLENLPGLAKRVGSKPAFVFLGEKWEREEAYRKLQNILVGKRQGLITNYCSSVGSFMMFHAFAGWIQTGWRPSLTRRVVPL